MRCKQWLVLIMLTILPNYSEELCDVLKQTTKNEILRFERTLYKYIGCSNISPNEDLRREILEKMNETLEYVHIDNSNIPKLSRSYFELLNLTQLLVEAEVRIVEEKTFQRVNISTIILDNNKISHIGEASFDTHELYVLSLKNNSVSHVTNGMFKGSDILRKLYLTNNQITDISQDAFKDCLSLDLLDLSYNKLSSIPIDLFKTLRELQTLFLNNNSIKDIEPGTFSSNIILQYLSIQNNYLTQLDSMLFPVSILYINAEYNNIRLLNVSNLIRLNRLILNYNKISNISSSLQNLPGLNYLHLNYNKLGSTFLNISFKELANLSIIEIDHNNITQFDFCTFQTLKQMNGVSLAENNLTIIDFKCNFSSKQLNLSSNSIEKFVNISNVKGLLKLDLSYNNLKEISYDTFTKMNTLQYLWLHHNSINKLEMGCFRDLKFLSELNLSHNVINNISSGVFNGLNSLHQLDLSYNNLSDFNEDVFHNLKILKMLSIAYNNITNVNVRKILAHTTWLREINLNGNNWTCKSLVNIVRDYKIVSLSSGTSYNVSNIYGIPCIDTDDDVHYTKSQYLPDIIRLMNLTEENTESTAYREGITNFVIIFGFILICCKYAFERYSSYIAAAKQFVYQKSPNEQEIQLV